MEPQEIVAVGIDGSGGSLAALRYAVAEATRRNAKLLVVTAYIPQEKLIAYDVAMVINASDLEASALAEAQCAVDTTLAGNPAPPEVEIRAVGAAPAKALIEAARGADLLVVGHRGLGGFASMLLGSVALACALHAPCPVTVVRPSWTPREEDSTLASSNAGH